MCARAVPQPRAARRTLTTPRALQQLLLLSMVHAASSREWATQWSNGAGGWNAALDGSLRLWDRPFLGRAASVTHYEQLLPFFARLDAGLPITVVGLGSSIVAGHSGCLNDVATLKRHVRHVRRYAPETCPKATGFVGAALADLNATWPHAEHVYINLGQPAADLSNFARRWCFTGTMPHAVDLVLVEQHAGPDYRGPNTEATGLRGRLLEELWVQLAQHGRGGRAPPFLVLSFTFALDPWHHDGSEERHDRCLVRSKCANATECAGFDLAFLQNDTTATIGLTGEDEHGPVLHAYGFSEISMRNMLASVVRDELWNLSHCQLGVRFFADAIHPSPTGGLFMADAILGHLRKAHAFYQAVHAGGPAAAALHALRAPAAPVNADAWRTPVRRCFDVETSVGMPVVADATTGWAFVEENAPGRDWVKPGWISYADGDVITIEVGSMLRPKAPADNVTLTVTYLRSYQNMGNATLRCASGCRCDALELQGDDVGGRVSLETYAHSNATQAAACRVQLVSHLPPGRKFKLLGLSFEAFLNPQVDV